MAGRTASGGGSTSTAEPEQRLPRNSPTSIANSEPATGLSPTTVLQLHRVLHHALRDAVRWSVVPRNVSDLVTPPRRALHEFRVLSPNQARVFLRALEGDRLQALYVLAITTGMRQGELFGLHWADVNLRTRSLRLVRQLKTRSSRRQILLPRIAVDVLKRHHDRQDQERRLIERVGRKRPGIPQPGRPAHQPFQLHAARLLSTT